MKKVFKYVSIVGVVSTFVGLVAYNMFGGSVINALTSLRARFGV